MKKLGVVDGSTPLSPRHPKVPAWKDAPHKAWQQRRMEVYAAQITAMDTGIGKLIAALRKTERLDNTLILFMIDNGGCHVEYGPTRKGSYLPAKTRDGKPVISGNLPSVMPGPENTYQSYGYGWANASNTPFRLFKQFDHEGGIHTPMIANWPRGIKRTGGIVRRLSHLIDVMPTVLQATGTKLPEKIEGKFPIEMDGLSFLPSLQGKPQAGHATLFFHHARGKAIRQGRWKLVQADRKKGGWELYDLQADPNELHDVAKANPERADLLKQRWLAWQGKQKARLKVE